MSERATAHIWRSIYVKTSNLRKLKQAHLPPLELALEKIEFDWQIVTEEESPGWMGWRIRAGACFLIK